MSQAEALLNSLAETVPQHKHQVPDSDTYFLIDPYTRQIENTNYQKTVLMQGDHNSERFTFELPRYVDGHDMSLCNRVIVHFDNVGEDIYNVNSDVAYTDDLRINPDDTETVICSWLIRREATQIVGILSFSLQYQCVEDEEITYEWNTDSYDDIEIRKSKNNGEGAIINYSNVLEEWRTLIFGAADSVMANISNEGANQVAAVQNESATQQAAIELKGSETLATIPDDYTEVYNMANEALHTKGDAIVCDAEGEMIELDDSSDDYIRGLNVYGKSTQFTTTGKNKLNLSDISERVVNGITLKPAYDSNGNLKYLNINGTAENTFLIFVQPFSIKAGTYKLTNFIGRNIEDRTLHAQICDSTGGLLYPQDAGLGADFTFENDADLQYRIYINEGRVTSNEKIYPMIRDSSIEDDTYEPYTGGIPAPNPEYQQHVESIDSPTVTIYNTNLLKGKDGYKTTANGLTCEYEGDGVYHIYGTYSGTNPSYQVVDAMLNIPVDPNSKYTISAELLNGTPPDDFHPYVGLSSDAVSHRNWMAVSLDSSTKIGEIKSTTRYPTESLTNPTTINKFWIYAHNDNLETYTTDFRFRVWLTKSDASMPYETYTEQRITFDRTVPAVKTTFAETYTDSEGIKWICDEIDLERGMYIQRINKYEIKGTEYVAKGSDSWQKEGMYSFYMSGIVANDLLGYDIPDALRACLCTHALPNVWEWSVHDRLNNAGFRKNVMYLSFTNDVLGIVDDDTEANKLTKAKTYLTAQYEAGTPVTVWYPLATPIETPLTAEEIEAYKSLRTNYPNTTVLNDSNAMMKLKDNADTKLYISNTAVGDAATVVEEILNDTY